jgi:mannonate dehydratase
MKETWRWFGPNDPVPLAHIRQAGATGVVAALHHIPNGAVWSIEEIQRRKSLIESAGLEWSVVESLPVSEDIKTRTGKYREHLDAYRQSLANLGACGIHTVCYNFMPVLDWTRTDLAATMPDGSRALRFDADAFAAFDLFILRRDAAEKDWHPDQIHRARSLFDGMSSPTRDGLTRTIIAGLPGAEEHYTLEMFRSALARYSNIRADELASHLAQFIQAVIPAAVEASVNLCIHPDDPPFPLLGLPRVMSTAAHVRRHFAAADVAANGLTFCTGSFGVRADNDLPAMVREFGPRIHFVHLRSTLREPMPGAGQPSFHEANHLDGDVDMIAVIGELLKEENRRSRAGRSDAVVAMRPDHGHQMLDDLSKTTNPGYSAIGRLRGLAELRGVARAVTQLSFLPLAGSRVQ